ncbi:hypothetical protein [Qipengyuania sp. JC766]|uniref:hypothetical protein n=1 Tax=Qipengyuania sp. JC766 TaxID=3232139 RepID=UPI0034593F10
MRPATTSGVTAGSAQTGAPGGVISSEGYEAVRADESIQYAPVEMPKAEPREPGWLDAFFEWLGDLLSPLAKLFGASWFIVQWILIALAVAMVAYLIWKIVEPALEFRNERDKGVETDWVPERSEAIALLEDADRLAAEGRYDEATHLLLIRSVGQIAAARPEWVEPSSTARELARLQALPEAARTAFGVIAERVERSLFALKSLGREDWQAARDAYARFALQRLGGSA